ncbi:MAG TPA: hypothetical protein ACHBX0_12730 [Arsenophonus sp.]
MQMQAIASAALKPFGVMLPNVAIGNTTILTQSQSEKTLDDADKSLLLLVQMGVALAGKKKPITGWY